MAEKYCTSDNIIKTEDVISPSGNYKLTITTHKIRDRVWNYTKGVIRRISDDNIIAEVARNYSHFHHAFFRNESEWLVTDKTYLSQCFINLDTGEIFDNSLNKGINASSFCWSQIIPNKTGTVLAVVGCIWGGPYETIFYDVTNIKDGWPELKIDNFDNKYSMLCDSNGCHYKWIDDFSEFERISTLFNKNVHELECEEISQIFNRKIEDFKDFLREERNRLFTDDEAPDPSFDHRLMYKVIVKRVINDDGMTVMHIIHKEASGEYLKSLEEELLESSDK